MESCVRYEDRAVKLLIAEDDPFFRRNLEQLLGSEFEISTAADGNLAWIMLEQENGPRLAILDWVMPGMTGPEICRRVRTTPRVASAYLILLTDKNSAAAPCVSTWWNWSSRTQPKNRCMNRSKCRRLTPTL